MKLYHETGVAPNPRRVRIFARERGIDLPTERISLLAGQHKSPEHLARNSLGQVPVLELDDGRTISESVSICRYLDAVTPGPSLLGRDAWEAAQIDMWSRRVEFQLMLNLGQYWIHSHPLTEPFMKAVGACRVSEVGEQGKTTYRQRLLWLDSELTGQYLVGDFSLADLLAVTTIDFRLFLDIPIPNEARRVAEWHERVSNRPAFREDLAAIELAGIDG